MMIRSTVPAFWLCTGYVTLGKSPNLTDVHFLTWSVGMFVAAVSLVLCTLHRMMPERLFTWCLAQSKG